MVWVVKKLRAIYFEIIGRECGKKTDEVQRDADRDFWFGAQDAVEYGLIDKVITRRGEID